MKSTDMSRKERELRKSRKKEARLSRDSDEGSERSVGDYIKELAALFFHDDVKIYNINDSEEILELLEEMKIEHPEKQWENVIRKAVKKTQIKEKDAAVKQLLDLIAE